MFSRIVSPGKEKTDEITHSEHSLSESKEMKFEQINPFSTVYYPIDPLISLALENNKISGQFFIINPIKALGLPEYEKGMCNGYTGTFAEYGVKGEFAQFKSLVSDICQLPYTDLSAHQEAKTLMKRICYYQQPESFGIKSSSLNISKLSKLLNSIPEFRANHSHIEEVYADEFILSEKEWLKCLEMLSNLLLSLQTQNFPLIMIFNTHISKDETYGVSAHRLAVYFDSENKEWHTVDINNLPVIDLVIKNSNSSLISLAQLLNHYTQGQSYSTSGIRVLTCHENPELRSIKEAFDKAKQNLKTLFSMQMNRTAVGGHSILDLAASEDNIENIRFYRDMGVAFNFNLINIATQNNALEILEYLVSTDSKLTDSKSDGTPAIYAAQDNLTDALEIIIKTKADLNYTNRMDAYAPIHFAAQNNSVESMRILLRPENHIDINKTIKRGDTAVCIAALKDNIEILTMLAENKADLELARKDGYRPVHMAAQEGSARSIEVLSKYKTNMSHRVPDGRSALCIALQQNHFKAAKQILFNLSFDQINSQDRAILFKYKKEILLELATNAECHTYKIEKIKDFIRKLEKTSPMNKMGFFMATATAGGLLLSSLALLAMKKR